MSFADRIDILQTDTSPPSQTEVKILDTFFKQEQSTVYKLLDNSREILIGGFIFIILSLRQTDELVMKLVPSTGESIYTLILVKSLMFMVLFFLLKNLYLVRRV